MDILYGDWACGLGEINAEIDNAFHDMIELMNTERHTCHKCGNYCEPVHYMRHIQRYMNAKQQCVKELYDIMTRMLSNFQPSNISAHSNYIAREIQCCPGCEPRNILALAFDLIYAMYMPNVENLEALIESVYAAHDE